MKTKDLISKEKRSIDLRTLTMKSYSDSTIDLRAYFIEFLSFETREWMKQEEEIKFRNSRRRMQITD